MTDTKTWIGIDVSKDKLDVHLLPQNIAISASNTEPGIKTLIEQLQAYDRSLVVLESTGGLERQVMMALQQAQIPVAMVNPRKVKGLAIGLGKAKTDPNDAYVLALFARTFEPPPQSPPHPEAQILSDLMGRRRQLVTMQVAEKNRLSRSPDSVQADIKAHLAQLKERIEALNQQINTLTEAQADSKRKKEILLSVKGIGAVTAALCIAELPELGRLSDKQIARLVGVV
jgi:transposase